MPEVPEPVVISDMEVWLIACHQSGKVPKAKLKLKLVPTWALEVDEQPSSSEETLVEDEVEDSEGEEEEKAEGLPEDLSEPC